jgi:hypothetical protein
MTRITVRKDLRGQFGPARDQGRRPTCLAFATSDTHAASRGPWEELSSEHLFYEAKKFDQSDPQKGARIGSVRHVVENIGQVTEVEWPYLTKLPDDLTMWTPPAGLNPLHKRQTRHAGDTFGRAWEEIESGSPVLIGMTTSVGFSRWDADGVIDADEPVVSQRRHAVIGVAAGEIAGTKCLMIRNSWGPRWGLAGYAWLTERYAAPRFKVVIAFN